MKSTVSKQTALKAMLLLVLATNVSWESAYRSIRALDLASDTSETATGGEGQPDGPADGNEQAVPGATDTRPPLSKSPNAVSVRPDEGHARVEMVRVHVPVSATMNVCGTALRIVFSERRQGSAAHTDIVVKELVNAGGPAMGSFGLSADGSLQDNGILGGPANGSSKQEIDRSISSMARQKLSEIGRCAQVPGTVVVVKRDPPNPRAREVMQEKIRNCQIDETGRPLPSEDKLRCSIDRLGKLNDIDDDNDRRARQRVEHELDRLVKSDISVGLRNRLMSKDPDRVAEGEELLDQTIDQIKDLGAEFDIDSRRLDRLVGGLEGLKFGAETYHQSLDMNEDARTLRQDVMDSKRQYGFIQPDVFQEYREFQERFQQELTYGPYSQLNQYRTYLEPRDLQAFTAPYDSLQRDLNGMLTGGTPQTMQGASNVNPMPFGPRPGAVGQMPAQTLPMQQQPGYRPIYQPGMQQPYAPQLPYAPQPVGAPGYAQGAYTVNPQGLAPATAPQTPMIYRAPIPIGTQMQSPLAQSPLAPRIYNPTLPTQAQPGLNSVFNQNSVMPGSYLMQPATPTFSNSTMLSGTR